MDSPRRKHLALQVALRAQGTLPPTEQGHVCVARKGLFVSDGAARGKSHRWKAPSGLRVNTSTAAVGLLEKSVRRLKGPWTAFDGHAIVSMRPRQQAHGTADLLVYEPLAEELTPLLL